jgi:hypothetical protein
MGVMKGYPDNTFRPNQYVTRAELAQVLANMKSDEQKTINAILTVIPSVVRVDATEKFGSGFYITSN